MKPIRKTAAVMVSVTMKFEPNQSLFLALVQHDLQRGHAHRQHAESPEVDSQRAAAHVRRIGDEHRDQDQAGHADWQVDVEDPAPGISVGDPPAQRGAEYGRGHDPQPEERHCFAALLRGKLLQQHGLGKRLEPSPGDALQHAKENQHRQGRREPAQEARNGEARHHRQQHALAAEIVCQPAAHGQNDGVGYQVRGENPGGFLGGGREVPRNVGQAYVDNRSVQHLHHGAGQYGNRHQIPSRYHPGSF